MPIRFAGDAGWIGLGVMAGTALSLSGVDRQVLDAAALVAPFASLAVLLALAGTLYGCADASRLSPVVWK